MKKLIITISTALFFLTALTARQITDMAGRNVTIPDSISRVVPYDNKTNVLLYPVAREKMIVKARAKVSPDLKYINKDYLRLREIDTRNIEEVIKLHPDIIVVATFVNDLPGLEDYIRFSKKANIPVVFVDLELMHLDKSYQFLGKLFNCQEKAEKYSVFLSGIYSMVEDVKKENNSTTVYLANMNNGLRTAPVKSRHAQLFDIMEVRNVAKISQNTDGFAYVSIEQVLLWNPDYIFCLGKSENSPYRTILKSSLWQTVDAVKNKKVFFVPSEPYPWFDMPPSVNRVPGLLWLLEVFYGQNPDIIKTKIIEFYKLFYRKRFPNIFSAKGIKGLIIISRQKTLKMPLGILPAQIDILSYGS